MAKGKGEKMKFQFSEKLIINSDVAPWRREGLRIAMLGGPGSGKSWNNSLIAEQFLKQGGTVIIFQPRDEYFTLKEKFDVLSVGGVHGKDIEFALTSPSIYAKAVVEDGISMIFYTSDVEDEEKLINWVSRFIRHILNYQERHKRPLLLILEEAHDYAPRSASGHIAPPWVFNRMIKAFKDCFTQGRKLNIIAICSSQRPQELNFTIRQLANLTFFGKFSDQDIGYVDKECLKYIRKQGIEVDASRLVALGLGEWLVIMGKQTRFIRVTQPRLTKHGAETPRLEYVAPRTAKAKKTVDQLTETIMEALRKEETEKSEIEKVKRKNRDLTKKLEVAEEKARIKLSVKDMLKGDGDSAKIAEELAIVKERYDLLKKTRGERLDRFKLEILQLNTQVNQLKKDNEAVEKIKEGFLQLLPMHNTPQGINPGVNQFELQSTKSIVDVLPILKPATINDANVQGKILTVAKKGLLDNWRKLGDIRKAITEEGWTVSAQQVNNGLTDLVKQQLIAKKHTDRNYFKLAKNVIFKKEES
jgi:hypothetical protein